MIWSIPYFAKSAKIQSVSFFLIELYLLLTPCFILDTVISAIQSEPRKQPWKRHWSMLASELPTKFDNDVIPVFSPVVEIRYLAVASDCIKPYSLDQPTAPVPHLCVLCNGICPGVQVREQLCSPGESNSTTQSASDY